MLPLRLTFPGVAGALVATSVAMLAATAAAGADRAPTRTITFVANAENLTAPRVRYLGREWKADQGGFLEGSGRGQRLLAAMAPGAGDFGVELSLSLPRGGKQSLVLLGDGEVAMISGGQRWTVRGRFVRAGDKALDFGVPAVKPGDWFTLGLQRRGEEFTVSLDGTTVHRGPCRTIELPLLGLDPGDGTIRVNTFSASGRFADSSAAAKKFGNPFGMQLRPVPASAREVYAPAIVREAPSNECSIVARRNGDLEIYFITKPESDSVSAIRSLDGGLTWREPEVQFSLPGRGYYAVQAIEARDGSLHVVAHVFGQGPGGYRGRLYEVYHAMRAPTAAGWTTPQRIVPGYVGAIRGFIETARGRLVLGVARAIPEREQKPVTGPDHGWNDTFVYYSDDRGATWQQSPDVLALVLETENTTRYGAVEPVLLELKDGRLWMLVRDRQGRLWESFSGDGRRWAKLARSEIISSDSPAELMRLRDGRIVMFTNGCQFWADPRTYAMGGRDVLHAAISRDEGQTWRGFREVLHESIVATGGDRGTGYPSAAESRDGKIVLVSGQGEGKHAIVLLDPAWLEETQVRDELNLGPALWTQYGDDGLKSVEFGAGSRGVAIPLKSAGLCGASWSFPTGSAGEIKLRVRAPAGVARFRLCLNDHFTRVDDPKASEHAVFAAELDGVSDAGDAGRWRNVRLAWSEAHRGGTLDFEVGGTKRKTLKAQRPAQWGVHHLRVEFRADHDEGDVEIAGLQATVTAPGMGKYGSVRQ